MLWEKVVLKKFAKYTVQFPTVALKNNSIAGGFLIILRYISEHLLWRMSVKNRAFACWKSTMGTLGQCVNYVQSLFYVHIVLLFSLLLWTSKFWLGKAVLLLDFKKDSLKMRFLSLQLELVLTWCAWITVIDEEGQNNTSVNTCSCLTYFMSLTSFYTPWKH